jgi:hypothetical protein
MSKKSSTSRTTTQTYNKPGGILSGPKTVTITRTERSR